MKEPMIYLLETLVCSGVLLAAYAVLLERRVRFVWCRRFLLAAPLLSAVIPLLEIPVWPGGVATLAAMPDPAVFAEPAAVPVLLDAPAVPAVTLRMLALGVYLLGAGLLFCLMAFEIRRIALLRRGAEIVLRDRYRLVLTLRRIASFTFFGSIYLWRETPGEELRMIVAHEASHIAHRHSAERMAMEIQKALLWWNPFVWIFARRLTEVEEFEVDSDVLRTGHDMQRYMTTIFKQQFGYSPEIANGLRNSLTKKRFQMMLDSKPSRYALLRLIALLPVIGGLLCSFSFTVRAAEVRAAASETLAAGDDAPLTTVRLRVGRGDDARPGVIVRVVGTDKGTVTDAEGRAQLEVPAGSVLELSYVGCRTQWLYVQPTPENEVEMFTTLEPGSEPDSDAGEGPVYFVDGFMRRSIDGLDSRKIQYMEICKGEQALARFGEAGRRGVIIVTTTACGDDATSEERGGAAAASARTAAEAAPAAGEEAYLVAETMPKFRGGSLNDFRAWVQQRVKYPAEALEKRIQGRVVATFVVGKDGRMTDVRVIASPDASLTAETVRVLESAPADAWTPGRQKGEAVCVKYTIPVDFRTAADEPQTDAPIVEQQGRVTDADGNPVPGAIVRVAGSQTGTVAGRQGGFSLQAARGSELEISYVGLASARAEVTGEPLEVVLVKEDDRTVDELTVVGFGERKK